MPGKRKITGLILLFFCLSISAFGQKKHMVKLGLNKLFFKQFFVAYEYQALESFSINAEVGFIQKAFYLETVDSQYEIGTIRTNKTAEGSSFRRRTSADRGYEIALEARYRPSKMLQEGLYIGVKSSYQYASFGGLEVGFYDGVFEEPKYNKYLSEVNQHAWSMGGTVGFNIPISKVINLDINIFTGYLYLEMLDPEILDFIPYAEPELNAFRNNHRIAVDRFTMALNVFVGF